MAELHLPSSGIEKMVDSMPFPHVPPESGRDGLMFLALCSVRRLFNRIHSMMYAGDRNHMLALEIPRSDQEIPPPTTPPGMAVDGADASGRGLV